MERSGAPFRDRRISFTFPPQCARNFWYQRPNGWAETGWLVVDRKFPADEWLKDFQSAYRMERTMDFGSYYAIRFVPK